MCIWELCSCSQLSLCTLPKHPILHPVIKEQHLRMDVYLKLWTNVPKQNRERKFQTLCKTNFLSRVSVFILAAMTRSCASDRIQQKMLTWTKSSIFSKVSVAGWFFFFTTCAVVFTQETSNHPQAHTHTHTINGFMCMMYGSARGGVGGS